MLRKNIKNDTDSAKRIIVALDVGRREEALSLVKQLQAAKIFKVGLKLFTAEGPSLLQEIQGFRKKVFLDLKLHDIPNTVSEAVRAGVKHSVHMLTIHASGGREMMAAAVEASYREAEKEGKAKPFLLAVTILTSLKNKELREIGMPANTLKQVLKLARLAKEAGMDGVVCSPEEIEVIKREFGKGFLVVTPGIRPSWAAAHDQKRIMIPSLAIQKGADYLVIGRPIIRATSPKDSFIKIAEELDRAVNSSHSKDSS